MIAMIVLAAFLILVIGLILGALCGRAVGWHEGYEAASRPGEEVPANTTPFIRSAGSRDVGIAIEHWTGHRP